MKSFFVNLKKQLYFLDEKEQDKIVNHYRKKLKEAIDGGKKPKEALKSLGSINKIVRKVCEDYNLNYEYCVRQSRFDKDISNVAKFLADFIRDIIKVIRKVQLGTSLQAFLEVAIKIIVLIFFIIILKIPFILLDNLATFINRFLFYPFNGTFDLFTTLIISLAYIVGCVIITLKVFGSYHVREKKIVKDEDIEKIDYEYGWLDFIVRIVIYLVILIPLVLLTIVDLIVLVETAYLVARGVDLIGIPIILAGLFGILCTLVGAISDSLKHHKKSYLLAIILSAFVFVAGIVITIFDFNKFEYPKTLENSAVKPITDEVELELDYDNTRLLVTSGDYEIVLDDTLENRKVRVAVSYYDDYVDVKYHQEVMNSLNYLVLDYELDDHINYSKVLENVVKDLKKGYIFNYSDVRKLKVTVYANEKIKGYLEKERDA